MSGAGLGPVIFTTHKWRLWNIRVFSPNRDSYVPMYEDGSAVLRDQIPDKNVSSPSDTAAFNELRERMIGALSELTPREQRVVQMRYGLNESSDYTLQEIGGALHLSGERVRQIESDALEKLRRLLKRRTENIYRITKAGSEESSLYPARVQPQYETTIGSRLTWWLTR
jgi:DNA-binding CsgD family transcriptional regulator